MSELGQFALGIAIGLGALGFFFGPIGKALGARIGGEKLPEPATGLTTGEMTAERILTRIPDEARAQLKAEG